MKQKQWLFFFVYFYCFCFIIKQNKNIYINKNNLCYLKQRGNDIWSCHDLEFNWRSKRDWNIEWWLVNQIGLLDHVPCVAEFVIKLSSSSWRVLYSKQIVLFFTQSAKQSSEEPWFSPKWLWNPENPSLVI